MTEKQLTQHQKEEIITEFQKRKKRQYLISIPVIIAIIIIFAVEWSENIPLWLTENVIFTIYFWLIIIALWLSFYNRRCPSCKTYLGRHMNPSFCKKCWVSLKGE